MSMAEAELLGILSDLVGAASPNPPGDVSAATAVIARILEAEGIPYYIDESKPGVRNLVATLEGRIPGKGPSLMFNGHIDVIPAGQGWKTDPFVPEFRDGQLYGRGSVDMKGGVAAMLAALVSLSRRGAPFKGKILFVAVGDEEYHSEFGTKYLLKKGLRSDYAICGEPTGLGFDLGNRGLLMIDVVVKGKASHAGRPAFGINAVHIASKIIARMSELAFTARHNPAFEFPDGCASVVEIHGGERINVIPDRCAFTIDRRLMPGESGRAATEEIAKIIEELTGIAPAILDGADTGAADAAISLSPEYWHEPCWTPPENPIVASALAVYRRRYGRDPRIGGKAAGTDASHLVSMGGIPTLILGPGDTKQSHSVDEHIEFAEVVEAAALYEAIVEELMKC